MLEEGGGQEPGIRFRCETGAEVHATVEFVDGPSTSCAPLQLSKNAITCLPFRINVTSFGKDCCLIVDSFEKNYREKRRDCASWSAVVGVNRRRAKG